MIAASAGHGLQIDFNRWRAAIHVTFDSEPLDVSLFNNAGDMIPPGQPRRLEERRRNKKGRWRTAFMEDRHSQVEIVAVTVVKR